jgi:hypothetical protein
MGRFLRRGEVNCFATPCGTTTYALKANYDLSVGIDPVSVHALPSPTPRIRALSPSRVGVATYPDPEGSRGQGQADTEVCSYRRLNNPAWTHY